MNYNKVAQSAIWEEPIQSVYEYGLPVPSGTRTPAELAGRHWSQGLLRTKAIWITKRPAGHIGVSKEALDFLVPADTAVLAARDGTVVNIIDHHTESGTQRSMVHKTNLVVVDHGKEQTLYAHLATDSVRDQDLSVGSRVQAGQQLARTGISGWMAGGDDHLHFEVQGPDDRPENPYGRCSRVARFITRITDFSDVVSEVSVHASNSRPS